MAKELLNIAHVAVRGIATGLPTCQQMLISRKKSPVCAPSTANSRPPCTFTIITITSLSISLPLKGVISRCEAMCGQCPAYPLGLQLQRVAVACLLPVVHSMLSSAPPTTYVPAYETDPQILQPAAAGIRHAQSIPELRWLTACLACLAVTLPQPVCPHIHMRQTHRSFSQSKHVLCMLTAYESHH